MERFWLKSYPSAVPHDVDWTQYSSLVHLIEEAFTKYRDRKAYVGLGKEISFGEVDEKSKALAAFLQSKGLQKGDRVAIMMPNVLQYPVAIAGVLRAGLVVVNVNPLYTPRELEHQLEDSGAKAIIILENFAHTLQQIVSHTQVKEVVLASMGDLLGFPKGGVVNFVVRHVKKMVPSFELANVTRFNEALSEGARQTLRPVQIGQEDPAFLQYTGGTTGVSKGATLVHRNVIANVLQSEAWMQPAVHDPKKPAPPEQLITVCALPLYHIFALTVCCLLGMRTGGLNILIVNPRDLPALIKELRPYKINMFPAVNTLYNALAHNEEFAKLDFSGLRVSNGGGMAVQKAVADRWLQVTGCPICEGYGLSETSPSAICNPTDTAEYSGTIGLPLPSTEIAILDDDGNLVPLGERGEIAIRGPQVMAGYWNRPEETAKVMTADGFFKSGDIGVMDERGYVKIVDRKKDMILVSGFNVYPNEVEEVVATHPGVLEVAAVGVPDEHSGEAVKIFVVRKDPGLTERDLLGFCAENLTGYKRPRHVEFRAELPKTNVGKILRRELRDEALKKAA
ncbi:long-chain fatty acid--CoA ligase [Zeimonas arvi]|uniref:Long-chain-fatty-acid--CoA ligase n=1 Tax=Zeimonas arvi TaxID=2498847 RepID=A0A5C8NZD6_9BURK|nr:long-chain fatty acid--CoA ligase [Zeimonas arvi]TXL66462.1 long-chain fatty acid--CoA ligase [Zeimonas arvi]